MKTTTARIFVGVIGALALLINSFNMANGESHMSVGVFCFTVVLSAMLILLGVIAVKPRWLLALLATLLLCGGLAVFHNKGSLYDFLYIVGLICFMYLLIPTVVGIYVLLMKNIKKITK